jgi:hypothetical protein
LNFLAHSIQKQTKVMAHGHSEGKTRTMDNPWPIARGWAAGCCPPGLSYPTTCSASRQSYDPWRNLLRVGNLFPSLFAIVTAS